jgi:cysteine desulfurase
MIYMDHAATTPVDRRVLQVMLPYWTEHYGNPSAVYRLAREAAKALQQERGTVASVLGCKPREIIFTSCGSESDNLALRGVAFAQRARGKGNHIITTPIEHHAVLHTAEELRDRFGFELTLLPVNHYGLVNPDDVSKAIRDDTMLISVMYANNEVGTIEPIAEIGAIARERGIPFHTDGVQAGGVLPLDVDDLKVDLLSLSAHKFYGTKGVGLLYARDGVPLWPMQTGGGHERRRRAGTENVPNIVGLATALKLAYEEAEQTSRRIANLRDRLIAGVLDRIPDVHLNGHPIHRLPNNANFTFKYIEGEAVLIQLDLVGVAASSGSACSTGAVEPSHVLRAMGVPPEEAFGSLRLTLGRENTEEDVDYVLEVLPPIVERLRAISPLVQDR